MRHKIKKIHSHIAAQAQKHQVKIRFLVVGVWNTIFGYLVFFFLESVFSHYAGAGPHSYMLAIVISNIAAVIMAYSLHRTITFRSKSRGKYLVKEFIRFLIGNSVTVVLSISLLPVFVELFGVTPKLGGFFVTLICTGVSYLAHSLITFSSANRVSEEKNDY